jgi:SAM-dependent methyltransferase
MQSITTTYQMLKCSNCTVEFADPMIAPSAEWYDLAYSGLPLYPSIRWEYRHVLELQRNPSQLIDIGCGSGAFLRYCRSTQVSATGLDHSPAAIAACDKDGLSTLLLDTTIDEKSHTLPKASCLTAFHVLEHLSDPKSLFEVASRCSTDQSRLWLSIPSNNRSTRYFGKSDYLDQPPHHLTRWNPLSLEQVAHGTGWKLVKVHYEPIPLKTALWTIATFDHSSPRSTRSQWSERLIRWASYPAALIKRLTRHHSLSSFSMLAEYVKI